MVEQPSANGAPGKVQQPGVRELFANEQFLAALQNATSLRSTLLQSIFDPRRNVEDECGYPRLDARIPSEQLRMLYDRDAIAARVVEVMPVESWQAQPEVYETEDEDDVTDFESDWDNLSKQLQGVNSWYSRQEGSTVWEYLRRADILSRIGQFGIVLIGLDDGRNLMEPADGVMTVNDCYITSDEEKALKSPQPFKAWDLATNKEATYTASPLNPAELEQLANMVKHRTEVVANIRRPAGDKEREAPDAVSGRAVQLDGADLQYATVPGMPGSGFSQPLGSDAQYFGVQYGKSETLSQEPAAKREVVFLRCFDESLVQIVRYEWNINNPRFGQPVMYRVTLNDPREQHSGIGLPLATVFVHWSRVVHLAENLKSSEVFASPPLRTVLNNVLGLHTLYACSPEMFYKGAFPGLAFTSQPQSVGEVGQNYNPADLRAQAENYQNGLQRILALLGFNVQTLSATVSDPGPHVNVQIEAICIYLGIPVRVFKGSERGELASSQDDASWNDRLRARQAFYITPRIICRFIDRLIQLGVLSAPKSGGKPTTNRLLMRTTTYRGLVRNAATGEDEEKEWEGRSLIVRSSGGYCVEWPDLDSLTDKDKATILATKVQAYSGYASGGMAEHIAPLDFMTKFDDFSEEEAQALLESAEERQDEEAADAQELADEHDMVPTPPKGFQRPPMPPEEKDASDEEEEPTDNAFCPTGPGGGIDDTCGPSGSGKIVTLKKDTDVYHWTSGSPRISTKKDRLFPGTISTAEQSGSMASAYGGKKFTLTIPAGSKLLKIGPKEWKDAWDKHGDDKMTNADMGAKIAADAKKRGFDGIKISASVSGYDEIALFKVPKKMVRNEEQIDDELPLAEEIVA